MRLGLIYRAGRTRIDTLHQAGAARVRFPRPDAAGAMEAVFLNTAGGLTGGDSFGISVAVGDGASAVLTTAAAEKIYRSAGGEASISVALSIAGNGQLEWLPQPTIVFDRARLDRKMTVELASNARFLAAEMLIFGRAAMGESVRQGALRDAWRIRRDGALVFADTFRLDGWIADTLDRPGVLEGKRAYGVVLYADKDAGAQVEAARAALQGAGSVTGVSAWNGLLVARAMAPDGHTLQADLGRLIGELSGRPLPRVWTC